MILPSVSTMTSARAKLCRPVAAPTVIESRSHKLLRGSSDRHSMMQVLLLVATWALLVMMGSPLMACRVAPIGALWLVAAMGALMGLGQVAHSAAWWRRRDLRCWRAAFPWYLSMLGVAMLRAAIMVWYHGG